MTKQRKGRSAWILIAVLCAAVMATACVGGWSCTALADEGPAPVEGETFDEKTDTVDVNVEGAVSDTTDTQPELPPDSGDGGVGYPTQAGTEGDEVQNDTAETDTPDGAVEESGEAVVKKWLHEQLPTTLASWLSVVLGAVTAVVVTLNKVKKAHGALTESVNKMQNVKAEWLNSSEEWQKAKALYEQTAACLKEVADESRAAWREVGEWRTDTKNSLDRLTNGIKLGLCNTEELVAKGYAKDIAAALSDTAATVETTAPMTPTKG